MRLLKGLVAAWAGAAALFAGWVVWVDVKSRLQMGRDLAAVLRLKRARVRAEQRATVIDEAYRVIDSAMQSMNLHPSSDYHQDNG